MPKSADLTERRSRRHRRRSGTRMRRSRESGYLITGDKRPILPHASHAGIPVPNGSHAGIPVPNGSHAGIPVVGLAGYLRQVQSASSQQR